MKKLLALLLLLSFSATAGLPPTQTKGQTDSSNSTTFNFSYPDLTVYHSGVTATMTRNGRPTKNYIQYADFENAATTGWTLGTVGTLTNGLPTGSPTFGSGASGNLSLAVESSGQLAGLDSLGYVSSAATTSGNMVASSSYAIDIADQAKVLTVKFYYQAVTPGGGNFSGTSSNSYAWALWDVTNSVWLSSAGNFCMTQSSGVGYCTGTAQTGSTTANIRLVIYNANATTGAATTYFDDFYLGPQTAPFGPSMTDSVSFTPTGTWSTNTTYTGQYRRVGEAMEIQYYLALSGAPTSATLALNMPSGFSIDTTKISTATSTNNSFESTVRFSSAGTAYAGYAIYNNSSSTIGLRYFLTVTGTNPQPVTAAVITQAAPGTFANADFVSVWVRVPIVGWSSNSSQSSDTDTRVVAMQESQAAPTATVTNSDSLLKFTATPVSDTHGAFSTSSGNYTVPVSGYYRVTAGININATFTVGNPTRISIFKNGSQLNGSQNSFIAGGSISTVVVQTAITVLCSAGDTLAPFVSSGGGTPTVASNSSTNFFDVERLSGPSVIAATESVGASYGNAASTAINNTAPTVPWATKYWDSHSGMNTSTGVYTCPVTGKYLVQGSIQTSSFTSVAADAVELDLVQAGSVSRTISLGRYEESVSSLATLASVNGSTQVFCLTGDTLKLNAYSDVATTLNGNANSNVISITRVGN